MKKLNLNDLSPDAVAAVKAVIGIVTGKDQDTQVYEGENYLFSIHVAEEREETPHIIAGEPTTGSPAAMKPSDIFRALSGSMDEERLQEIEDRRYQKSRRNAAQV